MSLLTANNVGVISATVSMPLTGVWTADLVIDQPDGSGFDAGTVVTLAVDNGFSLTGSCVPLRTGSFLDAVHVRLVGGKGGMAKTVQARGYAQPGAYVRDVLNGIAADAGEKLSSTIDQAFMNTNLVAWTTMQCTASQALIAFLEFVAPTANWRFLADGTLWVGVETYPKSGDTYDVLSSNPMDGTAELGAESPSILPGVALDGVGNVSRVEHVFDDGGVRSHVSIPLGTQDRGPKAAIASIVAQEMMGVDYFGLYECKVISQSGNFATVDVQPLAPVDKKLPGLQRVEVRAGTGVKVQFAPGAKVLLGWKGGDARAPFVMPGLGADAFLTMTIGGSNSDNVITKQDFAALITAISAATYIPYPLGVAATPVVLAFVPPTAYASNAFKVQR